jgi:hypothetical protein
METQQQKPTSSHITIPQASGWAAWATVADSQPAIRMTTASDARRFLA